MCKHRLRCDVCTVRLLRNEKSTVVDASNDASRILNTSQYRLMCRSEQCVRESDRTVDPGATLSNCVKCIGRTRGFALLLVTFFSEVNNSGRSPLRPWSKSSRQNNATRRYVTDYPRSSVVKPSIINL